MSTGTLLSCDGAFAFDLPQQELLARGFTPGTELVAQIVYQDPQIPDGTRFAHTGAPEHAFGSGVGA